MKLIIDLVLFFGLLTALYMDLRYGKIYNWLTFSMMAAGIFLNMIVREGIFFGIKGLFIPIIIFGLPFALGWFGAGDVKLLAAIGALKGPEFIIYTLFTTAIAGGIMAVANLIKRRLLFKRCRELFLCFILRTYTPVALKDCKEEEKMPYSLAIFVGTIFTYLIHKFFQKFFL